MVRSEKLILRKIRRYIKGHSTRYDFWFTYNAGGIAISWEGGFELPASPIFRNKYSIIPGKHVVKNW